MSLEDALLPRSDLHRELAIPRAIRKALADPQVAGSRNAGVRVMRFDFHPTTTGWRVSEVNSDVPGGYNEASGWNALVAEQIPGALPAGDPAARLVEAISRRIPRSGTVALAHATAYADDHQVMDFLGRRFEEKGVRAMLVAPDHLKWRHGNATIDSVWFRGPVDCVFRFFPAEWLPNLGRRSAWIEFFGGGHSPLCNPATALLTQSKRWPLLLPKLGLDLRAWREFLPETSDPRDVDWRTNESWVLKPAMGRVGELVGLAGATESKDWRTIRRGLRWSGRHWIAQRRFTSVPIVAAEGSWHVCLGVYTVDGRAAGIYGRAAQQPLINHLARDLAVLVEQPAAGTGPENRKLADSTANLCQAGADRWQVPALAHAQTL